MIVDFVDDFDDDDVFVNDDDCGSCGGGGEGWKLGRWWFTHILAQFKSIVWLVRFDRKRGRAGKERRRRGAKMEEGGTW